MTLKKFSLLTLISGILLTAAGIILNFVLFEMRGGAVGIIGGAGLPTIFYMLKSITLLYTLIDLGLRLTLTALVCLIFGNTIKKNCTIATSLISLAVSASVALLVTFGYMSIRILLLGLVADLTLKFIIGILLSLIGIALSIVLICKYIKIRRENPFWQGVLFDLLTLFLYFPLFSLVFQVLFE